MRLKTYLPGILLLCILASSSASIRAENTGTATAGKARFTVITPNLIRMEYAPDGKFVDLPSWFAVERQARDTQALITAHQDGVEINTGEIHLVYQDNGKPFSAENLSAEIKKGDGTVNWKPGMLSAQNLGGTIRTVDGLKGPVSLGEGILSRDGWYLLDDSASALFTGNWIEPRPKNRGFDWYLFGYGSDFRAAFRSLTAVGGAIPLPRKYTLGVWYSRYWSYTADEFKKIVLEFRDHGFPLDAIVMDMGWHSNQSKLPHIDGWTGYTWNRKLIPDPPDLLGWFHDQGLHVTLNDHPASGLQPGEEMYADFMRAMGKDPGSNVTIPFDAADKHYLDTFYRFSHLPREKDGIDFWWLDWQQSANTRGLPSLTNLQVLNYYNYNRSAQNGLRGQSLSRWAGWGDHRYPLEFSGDSFVGWKMLGFEVPFTSTGGNAGAFFWSHDIGGHWGPRDGELYTRWCQFGALSATLRIHSTRAGSLDRRPWTYADWAEASLRRSCRLRSEIMPYLYTSMAQATQSSVPFIRPLYVDFPDAEQAYHNGQEYLFGDNLLVAPITQPGVGPNKVGTQAVWFPKGDWFDFFTGERFTGPAEGIAADPIDTFPLYVRGGVPLPMQAFTPHPGSAPLTDLILRCYPGEDGKSGTSTVYEDDGVSTGYERGESATTEMTYTRRGDEITVSLAPTKGAFKDQPTSRRCVVKLPCTEKLTSCSVANARVTYDDDNMMNRIELPETSIRNGWTLIVHAAAIDPALLARRAAARHLQDLLGEPYDSWRAKNVPVPDYMKATFAAAEGISLIEEKVHPYFLDSRTVLLYCHNHSDAPEPAMVTVGKAPAVLVSLQPGKPVPGIPINVPGSPPTPPPPVTVAFTEPSFDGLVLHEPVIHYPEPKPAWLDPANDLALKAKAEASSGNPAAAIDGVVDGYPGDASVAGYPGDKSKEWITSGQRAGAWIKLTWAQPVEANAIYLYDRLNLVDNVLGGTIEFDNGTRINIGALPEDGTSPLRVAFPSTTIHWIKFIVTKASPGTSNIGLAEIAVTKEDPKPVSLSK